MKKRRILSLSLPLLVLASCGGNPVVSSRSSTEEVSSANSSFNSSSSEEHSSSSASVSSSTDLTAYDLLSGGYDLQDGVYSANHSLSVLYFKKTWKEGTTQASVTPSAAFADNGLIFTLTGSATDRYFYGLDAAGRLVFREESALASALLYQGTVNEEASHKLGVYWESDNGSFALYHDDLFVTSYVYAPKEVTSPKWGFYAGGKKTAFASVTNVEGQDLALNDLSAYSIAYGGFQAGEASSIVSSKTFALAYLNNRTFAQGVYEADMNFNGHKTDAGILFALDKGDKASFWENGVSYYYFAITSIGFAVLGKVSNGYSTPYSRRITGFDNTKTYHLKAYYDGTNIAGYLNGELLFSYRDSTPLSGTSFGIRSGAVGVSYSHLSVRDSIEETMTPSGLAFPSGAAKKNELGIVSSMEKTLLYYSDKTCANGTITTRLVSGNSSNNGIVFGLSKPDKDSFYENEEGLSYYWLYFTVAGKVALARYEGSKVTLIAEKVLCAGDDIIRSYPVKIVRNGGDIACYFDSRLYFVYHDETPLTGSYVGLKAEGKNAVMGEISISSSVDLEKAKLLLIGHSYMELWASYKEDFPAYESINDIGIGASIASQWDSSFAKEIAAYEPDTVIYWIGINDLTFNIAPQTVVSYITSLANKLRALLPNMKLVLPLTNRCPARTNINSAIASLNTLIRTYADKNDWIEYAETELLYCNASGSPLSTYFVDGLHPTDLGYQMAANAILDVMGR